MPWTRLRMNSRRVMPLTEMKRMWGETAIATHTSKWIFHREVATSGNVYSFRLNHFIFHSWSAKKSGRGHIDLSVQIVTQLKWQFHRIRDGKDPRDLGLRPSLRQWGNWGSWSYNDLPQLASHYVSVKLASCRTLPSKSPGRELSVLSITHQTQSVCYLSWYI